MQIGDIVTHKSYDTDIKFVVDEIIDDKVILSGLDYRLSVDTTIHDLTLCNDVEEDTPRDELFLPLSRHSYLVSTDFEMTTTNENCFTKILHIDSNNRYLKRCLALYKELDIPVIGICTKEKKQPSVLLDLLVEYRPNILVITGHDYLPKDSEDSNDLNEFLNSKYFVKSIQIARAYKSNYDELVIIAGGCKSYYEALINAGANFASSPDRILVNITEPVTIACRIATTPIHQFVTMESIAEDLPSGLSGFGGLETRGQCRAINPNLSR